MIKEHVARALIIALFAVTFISSQTAWSQTENSSETTKNNPMNSFVSIFEIPATDIDRATSFYQEILGINIERMDFPGMEMGIFPYEDQMVTGVIMKGEGYTPSADGITLYLNGGDDLQLIVDKIEKQGGTIVVPKTPHADESGFFAIFIDSEGNKMGLHSPN
jgi:hypothetical protein